MTLTAGSVLLLVCRDCDADLRGAPKVIAGNRYLCATCALRWEYQRERAPLLAPLDESDE